MLRFRYTATDKDELAVSGELDAESRGAAAALLETSGLRVQSIEAIDDTGSVSTSGDDQSASAENAQPIGHAAEVGMSRADVGQVTNRISDITESGLPLAAGLLAISEEVSSAKLKRILTSISRRLDSGESLDAILQSSATAIPPHLNALLRASLRTGNLGRMIEQYVTFSRENVEVRRKVWLGVAYPVLVLLAAFLVTAALFSWVVPDFGKLYYDFGVELPTLTIVIINLAEFFHHYAIWVLPAMVGIVFAVWRAFEWLDERALRQRLVARIPIFGTLSHWGSLAQFCQLLAILIENQVPLPEALRTAAAGTNNANLIEGCGLLADDVEHGISLSEAATGRKQFPASMVNIFRWERHPGAFSDALYAAGEIFSARTQVQTNLVGVVCEPAAIIFVAVLIGSTVLGLFMPLINLLSDLS